MGDRRVHAVRGDREIVRYDKAGKWYVEYGGIRRHITVGRAARLALMWREDDPCTVIHRGIPGGRTFDHMVGQV